MIYLSVISGSNREHVESNNNRSHIPKIIIIIRNKMAQLREKSLASEAEPKGQFRRPRPLNFII